MKRRSFLSHASLALGAGVTATACSQGPSATGTAKSDEPVRHWKMVTSWPLNFPGLGVGANTLAEMITKLSGGRIVVKVYGGGELVPAFEVFDAVSRGTAELGHSASYYWKGKAPAAQFFAAVPFGMNAQEANGWLYYGGGLELWRELYAPFNLVPFPAGNTEVQMGGWFNKEINSVADLAGLKMRIPGLGGEVLRRAGGTPVSLPGAELFTALQSGTIDATEWVGPYNDLAFGLHKAARYYYYPGWHEPGPTLELMVNKELYEGLPEDLQQIVAVAAQAANLDMASAYVANNYSKLQSLINEHDVQLRRFPNDVMAKLQEISSEVVAEIAETDELSGRIYRSYTEFLAGVSEWHELSERAYYQVRSGDGQSC